MIPEFVLTLSVLLFLLGTVCSIFEYWTKNGLTYVSVASLALWTVASLGIGAAAWLHGYLALACLAVFAAGLATYALQAKFYTYRHVWKQLGLGSPQRKGALMKAEERHG